MLLNGLQSNSFSCSNATSWVMVTGLGVGDDVMVGVEVTVGVAVSVGIWVEVAMGGSVGMVVAVADGGSMTTGADDADGFANTVSVIAVCDKLSSLAGLFMLHAIINIDAIIRKNKFFTLQPPLPLLGYC